MRKVENSQMEFGEIAIGDIHIGAKSWADIPAVLKGVRHIYTDSQTRQRIFALLTEQVRPGINLKMGRSGKDLWRVLVLAVLKQGLGCDYDPLQEVTNQCAYSYENDRIIFFRICNRHGIWTLRMKFNQRAEGIKMNQQNQTVIDMEIVKRVVHFVTLYRNSRSVEDKHLKRKEVLKYFAIITPTTVAIEACESSNYWRQKLACVFQYK